MAISQTARHVVYLNGLKVKANSDTTARSPKVAHLAASWW